jgi:hypothetical protein
MGAKRYWKIEDLTPSPLFFSIWIGLGLGGGSGPPPIDRCHLSSDIRYQNLLLLPSSPKETEQTSATR